MKPRLASLLAVLELHPTSHGPAASAPEVGTLPPPPRVPTGIWDPERATVRPARST